MKSKDTHPNADAFPKGLSGPALRALAHAGIRSMAELARWPAAELARLHGLGPSGLRVLHQALGARKDAPARAAPPPATVDAYLAGLPVEQREALERLRAQLHAVIPGARETLKTRVPALQYQGKTVVGFGAGRSHLALYVMHGEALQLVKPAVKDGPRRVLRFSPQAPLAAAVVRRIVRLRLAEIDAQARSVARPERRRRVSTRVSAR